MPKIKITKTDAAILIACILFCLTAGFVGSLAMTEETMQWYATVKKSPLTPPGWVFAPVWTILYILMAIALFLIIKQRKHPLFLACITVFILQLALNTLWTFIFFANSSPRYAYIDILLLDISVIALINLMGKISVTAQRLMLPYVIWLGFATYLNWYIFYNI